MASKASKPSYHKSQGKRRTLSRRDIHVSFGDTQAFAALSAVNQDVQSLVGDQFYQRVRGICRAKSVEGIMSLSSDVQKQLYLDDDTERLAAKYMVASLLKKYDFRTSPYDKDSAALQKWMAAEASCRRANRRLAYFMSRPSRLARKSKDLSAVLAHARWFVGKMLGPFDRFDPHIGRHGPGSSLCTTSDRVTEYYKYADRPYSVSSRAIHTARGAIASHWQWTEALLHEKDLSFEVVRSREDLEGFALEGLFELRDSNRLTFVPKDAKISRPIAIEPRMNLYLQLGVHDYVTHRLKKFGVDLSHGQQRNQELARKGSIPGVSWDRRLATIDLSAASDSVSTELVRWLLPPDWFNYLDTIRSHFGDIGGTQVVYEKFSSMGNGFTFVLESVIFAALVRACMYRTGHNDCEWAVYGDDIVVPVGSAGLLLEVLKFCGFSANTDKTFLFGDFRESCGKDYHRGTNIRPLFIKGVADVASLFGLCNHILAITLRSGGHRVYYNLYRFFRDRISSRWLLFGPISGSYDSHIHAPFWLWKTRARWDGDFQQWKYRRLQLRPRSFSGTERFRFLVGMRALRFGEVNRRESVDPAVVWSLSDRVTSFGWCPAATRYFT